MKISLIIRDLLLHNEQLVIPGFGTFRVIHRPAHISKTTQVLLPPSKEIVFDSQHKQGDNLLLLTMKKKLGLSESETGEELRKFLHHLEEEIRTAGSVILEGLGKFGRNESGGLKFEPLGDLLNLTGVFALPKLEIRVPGAVDTTKPAPAKIEIPGLPLTRKKRKWWIPAAVLLLLAILASVAYYRGMFSIHSGLDQAKDTAVSTSEKSNRIVFGNREPAEKDSITEDIIRQLDERMARENALRPGEPVPKQELNSAPKENAPAREVLSRGSGPYHIISGSFTVPENAQRQQSHLRRKGLTPEILPKRGKYIMVSLGSYATRSEAKTAMEELLEKLDQDLWVMKIE